MGKKRLWVTIDTEMDADTNWKKKWPPQYSSVLEGIPDFYRPIWNRYNVHPIYFVSPEILYSEECCNILKKEIEHGAVIGAHLHPEYIEPQACWGEKMGDVKPQFPNSAYDTEIEFKKIEQLTELIKGKLGVKPKWYRAARFGADLDTIYSLLKLGYQYDSSVTPNIDWTSKGGPNHSKAPCEKYQIAKDNYYKEGNLAITEFPVTITGKRCGIFGKLLPNNWLFYQWLRPTHMTYMEMRNMVCRLSNRSDLVMMFHSMEIMVKKTPYVWNKCMQQYYIWRLEKILSFAQKRGYEL